jgi:F-type H+-transporting ATPase subunit delta
MEDSRIARRYAQALFGLAEAQNLIPSVEDDLAAISGIYRTDSGFRTFMEAPITSREKKLEIVSKLFGDRVTAVTLQALRVIIEKGRERDVPAIYDQFVQLRRTREGVVAVEVTSALPLDEGQKTAILEKIAHVLGKRVEPTFHLDPHLVGGVKVAYDNYVLDGTVRGAFSKLREKLRYELLKQR